MQGEVIVKEQRDVEASTGVSARAGRDRMEDHLNGRWSPFSLGEIVNGGMQTVALIVAVAFGVWAIKSYNATQDANTLAQKSLQLSLLANHIALISFCGAVGQGQVDYDAGACSIVSQAIDFQTILDALGLPTSRSSSIPRTTTTRISSTRTYVSTPISPTRTSVPLPPPPVTTSRTPSPPSKTTSSTTTVFTPVVPPISTQPAPPRPLPTVSLPTVSLPTVSLPSASSSVKSAPRTAKLSLASIIGIIVGVTTFLVASFTICRVCVSHNKSGRIGIGPAGVA